ILVDSEGAVRIADFGVARVYERLDTTRSNVFVVKLSYASTERLEFQPVDGRSHVFGVGVVLHEMLTGRALFGYDEDGQRLSDRRIGRQILDGKVRDPRELREGIPAALATACLRMLERDVAKRPTAVDAVRALQASRLLDGVDDERLKVWLRTQDATRRIEFADAPTRDDRGAAAMRSTTQSFGWASGEAGDPRLLKWATYALAVVVVVLMGMLVARRLGQGEAAEASTTLPGARIARDGGAMHGAGSTESVAASIRDAGDEDASVVSVPRDGGQVARRGSARPVRVAPARRTGSSAPTPEPATKRSPATEPPRDGGATPLDRLFPEGYELPPKPDAGERPALDPDALFPEGYDPGR
ncbi:MAG: protein kinase, partial [Deltaproteobacteria bacterium]